jgi:intracellular sulfur oxidation DsrE/DsrF family protein
MYRKISQSIHAILLVSACAASSSLFAGESEPSQDASSKWTAPVITEYGKVMPYSEAAVQLKQDQNYNLVFDVTKSAKQKHKVIPALERTARFINLAGVAKVPAENMNLIAVLHGDATPAALSNEAYMKRYSHKNPSHKLISELSKAGVKVMVCGQALAHNNFDPSEVAENVTVAEAALTVLAQYQLDGYALIPN